MILSKAGPNSQAREYGNFRLLIILFFLHTFHVR